MPADDLTRLVRDNRITASEAAAIRKDRRRRAEHRARADAEQSAWQERQAEENRMAPAWAAFVLAHSPAYADMVIHRDFPLRQAAEIVRRQTGCDLDCGHQPLTAAQEEAVLDTYPDDTDRAREILDHAPYLLMDTSSGSASASFPEAAR